MIPETVTFTFWVLTIACFVIYDLGRRNYELNKKIPKGAIQGKVK